MAFFAKLRCEMSEDSDYCGWGMMDFELHGEHLIDRRKSNSSNKAAPTVKRAGASRPMNPVVTSSSANAHPLLQFVSSLANTVLDIEK